MSQQINPRNEGGFTKIFNDAYAPLVLYAYRVTNNQTAAEDIVEDALISLWKRCDTLSEIKSLKSYLYTVVRNSSLSWIRKNRRESAKHQAAFEVGPEFESTILDHMIYSETMAGIYRAMDMLPRQCRKVFFLYYIQGKKISEIAKELKISVGTVKTHKGRGIDLLRKSLLGLYFWILLSN